MTLRWIAYGADPRKEDNILAAQRFLLGVPRLGSAMNYRITETQKYGA